jgi:hypothetical protein
MAQGVVSAREDVRRHASRERFTELARRKALVV